VSQLQTFKNELFEVSAKFDDGQILFDVEQVAKSLGIVQEKSNGLYVRWKRVNSYLPGNSPLVGKGDLIPEPLVYKLAFKASNEVAEKFQDWLAIEVIPSIRKHGAYMTPETIEKTLLNPDFIINLAGRLKDEQQKRIVAEQIIEQQRPKVLFAESVQASESTVLVRELARMLFQKGIDIGERRLFEWLRTNGYLIKQKGESFNLPTQRSMDLKLFEIHKRTLTDPDGTIRVTRTPKVTGKGQVYFLNKLLSERAVV
jgi:anti-repressor protein